MNVLLQLLVCFGFFQFSWSDETYYKAGIVENLHIGQVGNNYANIIRKAGENNVDILMLPSPQRSTQKFSEFCEPNNYDELIKSLSQAAKEAEVYVVAQLLDRVRCNSDYELFEHTIVFDRNGGYIPIFRNPIDGASNCNSTTEETVTFNTDFGVQFTHVSAEDMVLRSPKSFAEDAKNFIVSGNWNPELPFLASQFLSSWSSSIGANLLIGSGIYSGKEVKSLTVDSNTRLLVAKLNKQPGLENSATTVVQPTQQKVNRHEDLSQYTIKPLNLDASYSGHEETVCHDKLCCQFFVKTTGSSRGDVSSYSLVVFSGVRPFSSRHHIGVQSCAVVACAGFYKRSCVVGSSNDTSRVIFDSLIIQGNFSSENSIQYPTSLTTTLAPLSSKYFTFDRKVVNNANQITVRLEKSTDLLIFGVFGREFSKDTETFSTGRLTNDNNIYDYIFNDEMGEFIDYVWIRLRVLIVVVSIYILEMM